MLRQTVENSTDCVLLRHSVQGGLTRSEITLLSVAQRDVATEFELEIQPIALPESKSLVAGMPWSQSVEREQIYNESAAVTGAPCR